MPIPIPKRFNKRTHASRVAEFLEALQADADQANFQIKIFPLLLSHTTGKTRTNKVKGVQVFNDKPGVSKTTADRNEADMRSPATISSASRHLHQGIGTMYFVVSPTESATTATNGYFQKWHAVALWVYRGKAFIYDPDHDESVFDGVDGRRTLQVKSFGGLSVVHQLLKKWKDAGKANLTVYIGGGGNTGEKCMEMTRAWMYEHIHLLRGEELHDLLRKEEWRRIRI